LHQKRKRKAVVIPMLILTVVLLLTLSLPAAFAAGGGGGGGGGTGGGSGEPLALVSVTPEDGAVDVAQPVEIKLVFNKNVVHMSVHDANAQKFNLTDADGVMVPLDVVMADDQIEPEKREEVILIPKEELTPDTVYTITVAAGLESKSNTVLEQDLKLTFRTAPATAPVSSANTDAAQNEPVETPPSSAQPATSIAVVLVVVVAAVVFMVAKKLRSN